MEVSWVQQGAPDLAGPSQRAAAIALVDKAYTVHYSVEQGPTSDRADGLVPLSLLTAMRLGQDLHVGGVVSPHLLEGVDRIQDIYRCWDRDRFHRIRVLSSETAKSVPGPGVGCFFTGGVDSFYTVCKHRPEITELIYIDFTLVPEAVRSCLKQRIQTCAVRLGLPLTVVTTDVKDFVDRYTAWILCFGATLASVAHVLAPRFHRVYLAAGYSYAELLPVGDHPLLDRLWSSEGLEIVHDGHDLTRIEKLENIINSPIVRDSMQVCWEHRDGAYNCGRCNKCVLTMTELRAIGMLDTVSTFDRPLDLARLAWMGDGGPLSRQHYLDNLAVVRERGRDPELRRALERLLDRGIWKLMRGARRRLDRYRPRLSTRVGEGGSSGSGGSRL